jgi:hypothetical protein
VRVVLALVINFALVLGIWLVAYSFWKLVAVRVARSHALGASLIRLLSLLTPSGFGEVLNVFPLLHPSFNANLLLTLTT